MRFRTTHYTTYCDHGVCFNSFQIETATAKSARKAANREGWAHIGIADYCPLHAPAARSEASK